MVKFIVKYIWQKRRSIAFYLMACLVFGVVFAMYRLPVQAVIYPALLCALFAAIWMAMDMHRTHRRHKILLDIQRLPAG